MRPPGVQFGTVLRYGSYVVIAGLAVNALRLGVVKPAAQSVRVVPYTAVLAETIVRKGGVSRQGPVQVWALRSDGSTYVRVGPAGSGATIVFADGTQVRTNPRKGMRSSVRLSQELRERLRDPANCAANLAGGPSLARATIIGPDTVAGHRAVGLAHEGGGTTTELWYAVDAGCAPLKVVMDFGEDGRSETNLVTLDRDEPNAELFAVDGLREGPPSSLIDRPEPCDAACMEAFRKRIEKQDQIYFALRAKHTK